MCAGTKLAQESHGSGVGGRTANSAPMLIVHRSRTIHTQDDLKATCLEQLEHLVTEDGAIGGDRE